jgi:hypothetical protein
LFSGSANQDFSDMFVSSTDSSRKQPPNRRASENMALQHFGADFMITAGRYPDGTLAEIFMNAAHANSALDAIISDAAIAISLALQFGCPLDTLRHALKRDSLGNPSSPIGAALDLVP